MNIAFITSEAVPFSKTGGLADVSGALPDALCERGHAVKVFTPYYRVAKRVDPGAELIYDGTVPVGVENVPWKLYRSSLASKSRCAQHYFIGHDGFFDRDGLYGDAKGDYADSCARFIFFSRASLAACQALGEPIHVYHAHDWSTALVPVFLKTSLFNHPFFADAASLFTIHNIGYQGVFWHWDWPLLNLPWKHFNWKELEFHGKINLLKGALIHADVLNTVSPTYAKEIQSADHGYGLEGVLKDRAADLFGVVNGIDARAWNPEADSLIPTSFSDSDLKGKAACKQKLLEKFKLPYAPGRPLLGMIGRLIEQKGFDLIALCLEEMARRDTQLVVLGTGQEKYQALLKRMQELYPDRIGVSLEFDNTTAHMIEAGADIFLMPSQYEPCGLNQLYSLRYGAVPIVRKTGGLADTVTDTTAATLANSTATGFVFEEYTHTALLEALDRALLLFRQKPKEWETLQKRGMRQDWSWGRSAGAYVELYERARSKAKMLRS